MFICVCGGDKSNDVRTFMIRGKTLRFCQTKLCGKNWTITRMNLIRNNIADHESIV